MTSTLLPQTNRHAFLLKYVQRILQRISALRRPTRRKLKTTTAVGLTSLALALTLAGSPAHAATITVDGTTCTLADAITSANSDGATGGCTAGSGADTLNITANISLTAALPDITTEMTIEGNGHTIARNSGASNFRIFNVNGTGNLTLNRATITGGIASGGVIPRGGALNIEGSARATLNNSTISGNSATDGGGIANFGTATLNNSTISGNSATGSGGGIYNSFGTTTLNRTIVSGNTASTGNEIVLDLIGTVNGNNYNVIGHTNSAGSSDFTPSGTDVVPTGALNTVLNPTLGGSTLTHALVSGSPAVDLIPTSDPNCNPPTTIDQRGAVRAHGANRGGSACDAGAVEFASNQTPTAVANLHASQTNEPANTGTIATLLAALTLALGTAWAMLRPRREQAQIMRSIKSTHSGTTQ